MPSSIVPSDLPIRAERRRFQCALTAAGRWLAERNLSPDDTGNISGRLGNCMCISASGEELGKLRKFAWLDIDTGCVLFGANPSSETAVHRHIYSRRPNVEVVIHTHPDNAVAFSCKGKSLPDDMHFDVLLYAGGEVRFSGFYRPGSEELAGAAADCLEHRDACFLSNHGLVVVGGDMESALKATAGIERMCQVWFKLGGDYDPITHPDMEQLRVHIGQYRAKKSR